jgi:type IV pilus assembly protein PilW
MKRTQSGMTMVELLVTLAVLALVTLIVTGILFGTGRMHTRTARRAEVQMSSREGLSLMTTELRQAGADPANPPIGLTGLVTASATQIRIRADLNADGTLQTTEPSEDVTYNYDSGTKSITRNPGAGAVTLIPNVTSCSFTYYNAAGAAITPLPLSAANAALVRAVGVSVTSQDRDSRAITLNTRIALRNMD